MKDSIEAVENGFRQLGLGKVTMPQRLSIPVDRHHGLILVMPAYMDNEIDAFATKIVTVYPENPIKNNLPTILAMIILLDTKTGAPTSIMDGAFITAMRTGAASGVATKYLARKNSKIVGIIGTGVQAQTQVMAVCEVRDINRVKAYSPNAEHRKRFCYEMSKKLGVDFLCCDKPKDVVCNSDIVITATSAKEPVFKGDWLELGTHINGVGSHTPTTRELDDDAIKRSKVVVDLREAALKEAGDLIIPISKGVLHEDHIYANLGEIVLGQKLGRVNDDEITLFKSVGLAIQDVATANKVYNLAKEKKVGKEFII